MGGIEYGADSGKYMPITPTANTTKNSLMGIGKKSKPFITSRGGKALASAVIATTVAAGVTSLFNKKRNTNNI